MNEPIDILLVDGQGIAHPRGFGLASHLGIILDLPTIGCAKSHLYGKFETPGISKGSWKQIRNGKNRIIGAVLRSRTGVKPIFISQGHKISLSKAIEIILTCATRYRIPEPLRKAHHYSIK